MLLIRNLPANSMPMSLMSFSFPLPITTPSNSSIFLSLLASIVLLSFIRAAFLCFRNNIGKQRNQHSQSPIHEKTIEGTPQQPSSWASALPTWDALPSLTLPVSFSVAETSTIGKGVGMQKKSAETSSQNWQQPTRGRRGGSAFESPLPAIYQSDVPVSMAKMIMSRHTYRKPTNRPPARPLLPSAPSSPRPTAPPASSPSPPPTRPPSPPSTPARRTPSMV